MSVEPLSDHHANGGPVVLKFRPVNRSGRGTLAAFSGDEPIFVDTIDVTKNSDRDRYVNTFVQAHPGVDPKDVAAKLLELVGSLINAHENGGDEKVGFETQAQALIRLAGDAKLFRTADGKLFACVVVDNHCEVHQIKSPSFRRWLVRAFYLESGGPPSADALSSALGVLEARAEFEGPLEQVWTRVAAGPDDTLFLDLCDDAWRAVEISKLGWRVVENPSAKFRRAKGSGSLPVPVTGGSIDILRKYVNVGGNQDFQLLVGMMTSYFRAAGPFPIAAINGEQGSAKSTTSRIMRRCIDPNNTLLRCEPKEIRDLMIAAVNSWVVTLDNLTNIPPWLSDSLCRLATGGGFATRTLYENDEETHFDAVRPAILNGIEDVVSRFDLLDRCVVFSLPTIPESQRQEEASFWRAFENDLPLILGALLDAVSGGLRLLPSVQLETLPRMADFARWGEAVGRALGWGEGSFLAAYEWNRRASDEQAIEGSVIASAICSLVVDAPFSGSAQELLDHLCEIVGDKAARSKGWPSSPRGMSSALARAVPALRKFGIDVSHERAAGGQRKRIIRIRSRAVETEPPNEQQVDSSRNPVVQRGFPAPSFPGVSTINVMVDGDFEEVRL